MNDDQKRLTHLDETGAARMVDVSEKPVTVREAEARATVCMRRDTLDLVKRGTPKGDVLAAARIAGIMAAKRTADLIPLCHPIAVSSVEVHFRIDEANASIEIIATARTEAKTGVEMEAMVAASMAGLTIYDMCKAVDRGMTLQAVRLTFKTGGKSGTFGTRNG